jgi:hypothetical protein
MKASSALPDFVFVILFLLPGFVAAWLFYSLTAHPRLSPFERVIQALIFTAFIQVFVTGLRAVLFAVGTRGVSFGSWDTHVAFAWSLGIAVVLGALTSYVVNNDLLHSVLRKFPKDSAPITRQTSFPTEWFSAFNSHSNYVVLHVADSRRVYGWPDEWPNEPDAGHFALSNAEWLCERDGRDVRTPLDGVGWLLIPAKDVRMVEILERPLEPLAEETP